MKALFVFPANTEHRYDIGPDSWVGHGEYQGNCRVEANDGSKTQ